MATLDRDRLFDAIDRFSEVESVLAADGISASEEAAGLAFSGPSGTRDTYVILETKGTSSSLKLRNEDGREQTVKP